MATEVVIYNESSIQPAARVIKQNSAIIQSDWYGRPQPSIYYRLDITQPNLAVYRLIFSVAALRREIPPEFLRLFSDCAETDRFREGLWHENVFEIFLHRGDGYLELHLSPDGYWWVSDFSDYRVVASEDISKCFSLNAVQVERDDLFVSAGISVELAGQAAEHLASSKSCFLSAILQAKGGEKIYYALGDQKTGQPDFHRRANSSPLFFGPQKSVP